LTDEKPDAMAALAVAFADEVDELHAEIREHDLHTASLRARIAALGDRLLQLHGKRIEPRE
jgi:hypothetical protein